MAKKNFRVGTKKLGLVGLAETHVILFLALHKTSILSEGLPNHNTNNFSRSGKLCTPINRNDDRRMDDPSQFITLYYIQ